MFITINLSKTVVKKLDACIAAVNKAANNCGFMEISPLVDVVDILEELKEAVDKGAPLEAKIKGAGL